MFTQDKLANEKGRVKLSIGDMGFYRNKKGRLVSFTVLETTKAKAKIWVDGVV